MRGEIPKEGDQEGQEGAKETAKLEKIEIPVKMGKQ
jgi:hypothetical protein